MKISVPTTTLSSEKICNIIVSIIFLYKSVCLYVKRINCALSFCACTHTCRKIYSLCSRWIKCSAVLVFDLFLSFFVPVILESLDIREHLSNDLNNDTRNCQLVILTGNVRFWQVMIQKCLKPSKTKAWHRPKSVASPINTTWRENNNIFKCQKPKLLS